MSDFEERWRWITKRAGGEENVVQEKSELEHIYNLMKSCDCKNYLEIGAAEGTTLHILGSIPEYVDYIDFCEPHTESLRREIVGQNPKFTCFKGDSTIPHLHNRDNLYDCVLIDGGHDFATVLSDSILYAPLATKYIFWHDIQLPEAKSAIEWFVKRWRLGKFTTFINSEHYGYGIVEVRK